MSERTIYRVERFNGDRWVTLFVAPHPVGPKDLRGSDQYPPEELPWNIGVFTGLPGLQARVRVDDTVVELFDWNLMKVNPNDPNSDMKWGWKSVMRNYQAISPKSGEVFPLSFLG